MRFFLLPFLTYLQRMLRYGSRKNTFSLRLSEDSGFHEVLGWGQRGLLFGLDARVALGIFAALALVVGYLGFGRVQGAREAVLVKELQTLEDGLAAFQADVGVFVPFALVSGPEGLLDASQHLSILWDNRLLKPGFVNRWHGPYVHRKSPEIAPYGRVEVVYAQPSGPEVACEAETACAIWLKLENVPDKARVRLEEILDTQAGQGDRGEDSGRVRVQGAGEGAAVFYLTNVRRVTL